MPSIIDILMRQESIDQKFARQMRNLDGESSVIAPWGDLARSNSNVQNGVDRLPIRMEFLADGDPEDYDDEDRIRENDVPVEPLSDGTTI